MAMVFLQRQVRLHRILHSSVQELLGDSLMEVDGGFLGVLGRREGRWVMMVNSGLENGQ